VSIAISSGLSNSPFAACGGWERGGCEDTSHSGKGASRPLQSPFGENWKALAISSSFLTDE